MMLKNDTRRFEYSEDMVSMCRKCGTRLILLPSDKRCGYCFDCCDFLEV